MSYLFEDCELDLGRRELRRGGANIAVEPQVFDLLVHLIQHRDRVISKEELLASIWHGRIVSESALFNRINATRTAIGDTGEMQRLIKTLPRKGIRFVGVVHEDGKGADAVQASQRRPATVDTDGTWTEVALSLPDRPSLAVLPFTNMSGDPDQEYFADGISEDLITGLAQIRWLFVIARNSAFVYKHRAVNVKQVSRELGVRYVLEGSVRRAGNKLRITAQLVDAVTGGHHWADRYDRDLGDVFAVQDEIARSVAAAIEPQLLAAEGIRALARSPDDLGAWELVARAQTHICRLTRHDFEIGIDELKLAVGSHADYAPARGLLGFCLVFAAHMGWVEREHALQVGWEQATRAVGLDDRYAWGHIALGYSAMVERQTDESLAAFRRAVWLNVNSAAAHGHLSRGLAFAGRDREAIEHGEQAIRLSPLDPEMALFLGAIAVAHYTAGRYLAALETSLEAQRLRPGFQGSRRLLCASLAQVGRVEEAHTVLDKLRCDQPELSLAWIKTNVPYQTPALMGRFLNGISKAGLE